MWLHLITTRLLTGAGGNPVAQEQNSGGYYDGIAGGRRKTKRDVYLERVRLGIIKEEIDSVAEKIVAKKAKKAHFAIDFYKTAIHNRPVVADLVESLMKELKVTMKSPDYSRAIQAALAVQKMKEMQRLKALQDEEDEEEAILLLM